MIWSNDYLKNSLYQGSRLSLQMEVQPVQGDKFTLTEQNLLPGTFSIDRYVQSSDKLEIGSACASELSFTLDNLNGEFDGVIFEGAEIVVSVAITEDEYKIGTFTVDEKPRKLTTIKISALDDMVKLDKPLDMQKFPSSSTLRGLIDFACTECNVSYNADDIANYFSLPNRTVTPLPEGTQILYRDLIRYVCQLGIVNAYMDKDNVLRFGWYGAVSTGYSITPYERTTHTIEEKSIGIASLTVEYEDTVITAKNTLTNEDVDYSLAFTINSNPLAATSAKQAIVTSLFNSKLKNLTYRPFSASVKQMFPLEPMDGIVFVDKNENEISTFLTHTNFRLNANMKIEAKGESPTKSGYAAANPLTAQEQKILDDLRRFVTAETASVTDREYQLIEFNKAINSGMALHKTTANGVEYYHDQEDITLSDYIMVQNSAGVAWTDSGWNSGSPVWKYGISSNGEAILNSVDAYKIRADLITVTDLKAFNATIGNWHIGDDMLYCGRAGGEISDVWDKSDETADKLYNGLGNQVAHASFYIRNFEVDCEEGDVFYYTGCSYGNYPSYIFFDESGELLSSNVFAQAVTKEEIVAPTGARKAVFQSLSLKSKTDEAPPLIVTRNKTVTPSYTFFKSVTTPSDVVWASGAESLDSYDNAGFILYGDGRVRMGGNKNEGYVTAEDNMLHFYSGETNFQSKRYYSVGLLHYDDRLDFVGWQESSNYQFYSAYKPFLNFSFEEGVVKTNYGSQLYQNIFAGLRHYRGTTQYTAYADFGVGNPGNKPSIGIELRQQKTDEDDNTYYEIKSRIDIYENPETSGEALVNLRVSDGSSFTPLEFAANKIWYRGNMNVNGVDVSSTESIKTNIASTESVLDLFSAESSQIYSYNLKKTVITETEEGSGGDVSTDGDGVIIEEQVEENTSYGFVIGDGYAVPEQVLNKDGNAINLYSMAALTWKAVQELYLKIKALEENANAQ